MAPLREKYLAQIRKWDWENFTWNAKQNAQSEDTVQNDMDDNRYGTCYLGSCLSLSPSGKYYTPWANSNVDECDQCGGKGTTKKLYKCTYCDGAGERSVGSFMCGAEDFETCRERLIATGLEPVSGSLTLFKCNVCHGARVMPHTCNRCGGLGSYEAYQDQEFYEALDQVAHEHGGWIESGEGDPLDTFFAMAVEASDEDAEEGEESYVADFPKED